MTDWPTATSPLSGFVEEQNARCLEVYRQDPARVLEDANNERRIAEGGYSDRQVAELTQNAIDACRDGGSRIEVIMSDTVLYVANDGAPFTETGVQALMASDISDKQDDRIGRFGIGFKSVLSLSRKPAVLSRTVSMQFDGPWARELLLDKGYQQDRFPTMRLARALNPHSARTADARLDTLMEWASTVVVVPVRQSARSAVADQVAELDERFMLFSPHVRSATFRVDPPQHRRQGVRTYSLDTGSMPGAVVLSGATPADWRVVSTTHRPSQTALDDAGTIIGRETVEVSLAVPWPVKAGIGQFWAHFPTADYTTLTATVNAPWRLSDDRRHLLNGQFNREILETAVPRLIADLAPLIHEAGATGALLDLLPSRGRESRSWADSVLSSHERTQAGQERDGGVFVRLRREPIIPTLGGTLAVPSSVRAVSAFEGIQIVGDWSEEWAERCTHADRWAHSSVYLNDRWLKLQRLQVAEATAAEWLETLTESRSVEAVAAAIALAARIVRDITGLASGNTDRLRHEVLDARIVLLENGTLAAPERGAIFIRPPGQPGGDGFVDAELARHPNVRENLAILGVVVHDRAGELRRQLSAVRQRIDRGDIPANEASWGPVWTAARYLDVETAAGLFIEELRQDVLATVHVRSGAATWRSLDAILLPGRIVASSTTQDREFVVDERFHSDDLELLRRLGATDAPVWSADSPRENWLDQYEAYLRKDFVRENKGRVTEEAVVLEGRRPPWHLGLMFHLSPVARAALSHHVILRGLPERWRASHRTNRAVGRRVSAAPEVWMIQKYGALKSSLGPMAPSRTILAQDDLDPEVLPLVDLSEEWAQKLGVALDPDDLHVNDWLKLKTAADGWADDRRRFELYAWLPGRVGPHPPDELVVRVGQGLRPIARQNIGITTDPNVFASLREAGIPAMIVEDTGDCDRLIDQWDLKPAADLLEEEIVIEPSGEGVHLLDRFPILQQDPSLAVADHLLILQPCTRIEKIVATPNGQRSVPMNGGGLRDGMTVYVIGGRTEDVYPIVQRLLGLETTLQKVLDDERDRCRRELERRIRGAGDDDERLVIAAGEEALRRAVPGQALDILEADRDPLPAQDVARLARAVHGVGILGQLKAAMEANRLRCPTNWDGGRYAREFVTLLGFPPEWAGGRSIRRPSLEIIEGPVSLEPLHDYQVHVTRQIRGLLGRDMFDDDRGLVWLPTGAGKTRVTVQALVDSVTRGQTGIEHPMVWIAQTDELCEQAAETWTYVWRAVGPGLPMALSRLWAQNEATESPGSFQLVVATIDKLDAITDREGEPYEWLRTPSVVVVDEAHGSIAPEYTNVLNWLGRLSRHGSDTWRPLIGLTATPFRGHSEGETKRLINRYGGNRLDRGAFRNEDSVHEELQDMGVLARIEHRILDGVDADLTEREKGDIDKMSRLPPSVESRLSASHERTKRIVESIADLPEDWPVLLFGTSVDNSRVIASLLSHRGIPAISISGDTDRTARRGYIEDFKEGRLRVITNYNVLTQGFDAPKVRAVYVTRPTFSPNVYQQMVGRGLRGPKNGGSDEVLIVNVEDNFEAYGDRLAFNEFEYLWRQ